jgi:Methylamine utilisation protein MauE
MTTRAAALWRPPIAALLNGLLVAGMAAGQLASLEAFGAALESYELLGPFVPAAKLGLPVLELAVAVGLLLSRRLPSLVSQVAGLLGLLVALVWATLAAQAFARGLVVANCGCFGAYLAQSLRWWVLLEDAYMLALAFLAARSLGVGPQPGPSRSSSRSLSITRLGSSASAGGCSRPSPRSESSVASSDR